MLTGDVTPVTQHEMDIVSAHELQHLVRDGGHARHYHRLGVEGSGHYMRELATLAHLPPVAPHLVWLFKLVFLRMLFSCLTVKQHQYKVETDGRVREWHKGGEINTMWDLVRLIMIRSIHIVYQDFWGLLSFATKTLRNYLKI